MIRKIYYGIVTLFAFAFSLITCVGGMFDDMCGNEISQEILSPNGKLKAVIFTRNCGATTGFSTQISLLPKTQKLLNSGGNIFTTDWYGQPPIEVNWVSNEQLIIKYPREAKTFTKETDFDDITIKYETYDETQSSTSFSPKPEIDGLVLQSLCTRKLINER